MERKSPLAEAPMALMKYLVAMDPPLASDSVQSIIQHLRGVSIEERDKRAENLLDLLKQGITEEDLMCEIEKYRG